MKEKLKSILDAPTIITILGQDSVRIENSDGVSGFTSCGISVKAGGSMVLAEGDGLEISHMQDGVIVVCGKIRSVSFA